MDFCTDSRVADDIVNTFSHIIKAPGFHSQAPKLFIQGLVLLCSALYWVLGHEQGQVPGWAGRAAGLVGITFTVGSLPLSPANELRVITAVTHQDVPRTSPLGAFAVCVPVCSDLSSSSEHMLTPQARESSLSPRPPHLSRSHRPSFL